MSDKNSKKLNIKKANQGSNKGFINKILNGIEWFGNKLPKPFYLFIYLIVILMIVSMILSLALPEGVKLENVLRPDPENPGQQKVFDVYNLKFFNLIGKDGVVWWFTNFITNFMGLATTGIVLLTMIFVTVAEKSGFINISLKKIAVSLPRKILTPACIFMGCISNLASDAGYLILIPLAGTLYYSMGRHPLTGIAAVFAGVSGGFATSLVPGGVEFLITSLTNTFLGNGSPYKVTPLTTYFFTLTLLFIYTLVGWFVTEKIIDKRLMARYPINRDENFAVATKFKLEKLQRKAMWFVLGFVLLYLLGITLLTVIPNAPFNGIINPVSLQVAKNAGLKPGNYDLLAHLVLIIGFLFLGIGIVYGVVSKEFKSKDDIVVALVEGFKRTGPSMILFLVMTQFIAAFSRSGIDVVLGYYLGSALKSSNTTVTLFLFILIVAVINLFIGSLSAKWGLIGPIFVTALIGANIHPAATIAAYRVGDSATNLISPLMPYFPLIILYCQGWLKKEEKEKFEIGSLMSIMLPFSLSFLAIGTIVFLIWAAIGIPFGVGGPVKISASTVSAHISSLSPSFIFSEFKLGYQNLIFLRH